MDYVDFAEEQRKLRERYAELSDEQIALMWTQIDDYTDLAQRVLREEIFKRGLAKQDQVFSDDPIEIARQALRVGAAARGWSPQKKSPNGKLPEAACAPPNDADPAACDLLPQGFDPKAYDLVGAWEVSSPDEARKIMRLLDTVGIRSYLGHENVERVEDYKGTWDEEVEIKVMKFQRGYVMNGLRNYLRPKPEEYFLDEGAYDVRCPRCGCQDVILEGLDPELPVESAPEVKNKWNCPDCCHRWEDDGIVRRD
jgi:hypothetical protein